MIYRSWSFLFIYIFILESARKHSVSGFLMVCPEPVEKGGGGGGEVGVWKDDVCVWVGDVAQGRVVEVTGGPSKVPGGEGTRGPITTLPQQRIV